MRSNNQVTDVLFDRVLQGRTWDTIGRKLTEWIDNDLRAAVEAGERMGRIVIMLEPEMRPPLYLPDEDDTP